jgi:trehalose 6-phosphate phosphatase
MSTQQLMNPEPRAGGLADALQRLMSEGRRIALFADADGTLLDIAMKPDEVYAPEGLVDTLDRAFVALDGALAIVTGRRVEEIDRIFDPTKLPASGVHGAQTRVARDGPIVDRGAPDIPQDLANAIRKVAAQFSGTLVEDKREALAVHWRAAPQVEAALHDQLVKLLQARGLAGLTVLRGHYVFEIKSPATSKGDAVRVFMQRPPFAERRPVFIGDDVTDVAGMAAAKALGGLAFSVGAPLPGADGMFASPADVRAWLHELVRRNGGEAI